MSIYRFMDGCAVDLSQVIFIGPIYFNEDDPDYVEYAFDINFKSGTKVKVKWDTDDDLKKEHEALIEAWSRNED